MNDIVLSRPTNHRSQSKSVEETFREIDYCDGNNGWGATEHTLLRTTDGGKSWVEIRKAATRRASTVAEPYREGQGFIERIRILSRSEGWIVEDSALLHTTDGGSTWKRYSPEYIDIRSFRFADKNNGWYIAQHLFYGDNQPYTRAGEIYETRDGGLTWQKVPVAISLEGIWLLDIWIASPNHIWVVGDIILHSHDAGKTWEEVKVERGLYGRAVRVNCIDGNTGWITANGYLVTTDGGKNWNPRTQEEGVEDLIKLTRRSSFQRQ